MKGFAPRWLLSAQGVLAAGDPHLRDGYHIRLHPAPPLGLPIVPLVVYRSWVVEPRYRDEVTWVDSRGVVLAPPFQVSNGNPVHGYLPPPSEAVCGWFQILGQVFGPGVPAAHVRRIAPPRAGVRRLRAADTATAPVPLGLRLDAEVTTARGWATVSSSQGPFAVVSATPIERVTLTGSGVVESARWIDLLDLRIAPDNPIALLHLPVQAGRRYRGAVDNAYDYALGQAERAAPLRRALHETPWVAEPAACPLWSEADERARVEALAGDLVTDVQTLVDDMARQLEVRRSYPITQGGSPVPGTGLDQPLLSSVLTAMQDPGVARLMGFMTWDGSAPALLDGGTSDPDGLAYSVFGFWEVEERDGEYGLVQPLSPTDQAVFGRPDTFLPVPADTEIYTRRRALREAMQDLHPGLRPPEGWSTPVAKLQTIVLAMAFDPMPSAPAAPLVTSIAPTATPWRPGTAPAARRRIEMSLSGLKAGAGLALARRSEAFPLWLPLNPSSGGTYRALVVPAAPPDAPAPGAGEAGDGDAPEAVLDYRIAQCDGFGRWSGWRTAEVGAGVRPPPPRPVVEAFFTPAALPDPPHDAPLAGGLRITVAVPAPEKLPPGGRLLDRVRILIDGAEVAALAPGSASTIVHPRSAPALAPATRTELAASAVWVDTAGVSSPASNVVRVNCYDLRSPPQSVLPNGLQYAARADAAGRCRAHIQWPVLPGQSWFRVFHAHESALRGHLEALAAAGDGQAADLLARIATMSAPDRAAELRASANRALFPRAVFELLTEAPIEADGASGSFEHALSAAQAGLSFYRVVAVAETNVEAPFEPADLLPVGVPNSPPPRAPGLEVAQVEVPLAAASTPGVRVRITVPPGLRGATEYRLFRSNAETREVARMPLVASGVLAPAPASGAAQVRTVLLVPDAAVGAPDPAQVGAYDEVVVTDIRPWMRYHFRADVRGAPEPGSGVAGTRLVPGEWSDAAPAVALLVVLREAPAPATALAYRARNKTLRWQHPDPLRGRHAGNYVFDIYRRARGGRETLLASVFADAPPEAGGRNANGSGSYHVTDPEGGRGVRYRVVLSDPLGRPGPYAELTV